MLIQNGELVTGTLCKKTLGASQGSLIHVIWNEEGPEAARAFLSQTQFCVNYWLLQHGMSIGIGDTVANADTMKKITEIISGVSPCCPSQCPLHACAGLVSGVEARTCGWGACCVLHERGLRVMFRAL